MYYFILGAILLFAFLLWQNNSIVKTYIAYKSDKVPKEFDGFCILHLSDLHNKKYPLNALLKRIKNSSFDMIAITGDIVNSYNTDVDYAISFVKELSTLAPTYFVSGNHEVRTNLTHTISSRLESLGAFVLDNKSADITKNGAHIHILGASADLFSKDCYSSDAVLSSLCDFGALNILLAHHPEKIDRYSRADVDLCLCGHAHGGQVRLVFIGGLYAPGQGIFPKYTSGMHKVNGTDMIISRGLSNSSFPFRIFNRPELVYITLSGK